MTEEPARSRSCSATNPIWFSGTTTYSTNNSMEIRRTRFVQFVAILDLDVVLDHCYSISMRVSFISYTNVQPAQVTRGIYIFMFNYCWSGCEIMDGSDDTLIQMIRLCLDMMVK